MNRVNSLNPKRRVNITISPPYFTATGTFTQSTSGNYTAVRFTGNGTIKFNYAFSSATHDLSVICVGGGGGGGGGLYRSAQTVYVGGGGGGGGASILGKFTSDSTSTYTITVSPSTAGGLGNNGGGLGGTTTFVNTSTSTTLITCYGGYGGASWFGGNTSATQGSYIVDSSIVNIQSGGVSAGTLNQGGNGGNGFRTNVTAVSAGQNSPTVATPFTGIPTGFSFTIDTTYSGGGGGGGNTGSSSSGGGPGNATGGAAGTAGTASGGTNATRYGGGGGGAGYATNSGTSYLGGSGAAGVVIIYFKVN